ISVGVPCAALQAMIFGLLGKFSGFYVLGLYGVLFMVWLVLGVILNRVLKGISPELLVEIPPYRIPDLIALWHKLFTRIKGFLIEAIPVVLLGVLIVNLLLYFRAFEHFSAAFAPVVQGLFGLPRESVIALIMGFFRKDVAVGMLMPLNLGVRELFIACALLAVSFPCVATFVIMFRELGWKDFLKSCAIMLAVMLIVGGALNLGLPR
ncbi:MAG: nucleoside recognition domain-containing protein, partial [Candidatus Omnitrophota bacterium]